MTQKHTESIILIGYGSFPDSESTLAPGITNRLWQFLQPLLENNYQCVSVLIDDNQREKNKSNFQLNGWKNHTWHQLTISLEESKLLPTLKHRLKPFNPLAYFGIGSLQPVWTACKLAGESEKPIWADFFGDPLSELQAKSEAIQINDSPLSVQDSQAQLDAYLHVWRLMTESIYLADAFSVVSKRQHDALVGQLGLLGRSGLGPFSVPIHVMPCALHHFTIPQPKTDRNLWLQKHNIDPQSKILLWSGGFNAWSDPQTLLSGVEEAMDHDPNLYFVVTGGPLPGYLHCVYDVFATNIQHSRHQKRIQLMGWLPLREAEQWLSHADFGILVDRPCSETHLGSRNRILNYAAAMKPIVASYGSEIADEMANNKALIGFESGNSHALAASIFLLTTYPEESKKIAETAKRFCEEHYTFNATSQLILDFCSHLKDKKPLSQVASWLQNHLCFDIREAQITELNRWRSCLYGKIQRKFKKIFSGSA